ncbi:phytanoyl-CoA dioxygenase family protein [Massilia sp. CF038]|uniref:phytanoyl-CoA dioxygenase family protein n=1 Tax=Massilia sp. CF038 TaxID=1881045 RepID=UPI0009145AD6|nr:phytanoyl-CoA dioxygenase family protein [Massilia sp. CF038]SHH00180.1 Phytanoyl-CoA dioxygenase (PhyH) [Massilia sp. CF038]
MSFSEQGFALFPAVLTPAACTATAAEISLSDPARGGTRCLLAQSWCATLAASLGAHPALAELLGTSVAVQCNYFEKSAGRNWLVPIHQDLSIPVAERVEAPELRGWSEKEGGLFVQAPRTVLEQMVAVRVHLDDCAEQDGPLRVVPGSHLGGLMGSADAIAAREARGEVSCTAKAGDVLVLRPLLLHASSKGSGNSRRRVLHFVFGPPALPHGLQWAPS